MSHPYQDNFSGGPERLTSPLDRKNPTTIPASQAPSFKTDVSRNKTQKWVEAKSASYGGDDWGEYDEDDEYGVETSAPPQTATGTNSNQPGPAPKTLQHKPSFEKGDEHRVFSTGQPIAAPQTATMPLNTQHTSRVTSGASTAPTESSGASTARPENRRDFTPTAMPPPLHTSQPTANTSVISPLRSTESLVSPGVRSPSSGVYDPRSNTPGGSTKALPFIRPADIYKRMEEAKEQERRASLESSNSGHEVRPSSAASLQRTSMERVQDEASKLPKPSLASVPERKSEYGASGSSIGAEQPQQVVQPTQPPARNPPIPRQSFDLPKVGSDASFGADFWGPAAQTGGSGAVVTQQPPAISVSPTTAHASGQPHGFQTLVDQAFQPADTPLSKQGSLRSYGTSAGTSDISPILSPVLESSTPPPASGRPTGTESLSVHQATASKVTSTVASTNKELPVLAETTHQSSSMKPLPIPGTETQDILASYDHDLPAPPLIGSTTSSRSASPSKGRVRDLASQFDEIETRRSSVVSTGSRKSVADVKVSDSPHAHAAEIIDTHGQTDGPAQETSVPDRRPNMPGQFDSYALDTSELPTPAPDPHPMHEIAEKALASRDLRQYANQTPDLTPTTQVHKLEGKNLHSGPISSLAAAGSAMGEAIRHSLGKDHGTEHHAATQDTRVRQTGDLLSSRPIAPLKYGSDISDISTITPTPPVKDTEPPSATSSAYSTATPIKDHKYPESSGSAALAAPQGSSDVDWLKEEIDRSLTPLSNGGQGAPSKAESYAVSPVSTTTDRTGTPTGPKLTRKFSWESSNVSTTSQIDVRVAADATPTQQSPLAKERPVTPDNARLNGDDLHVMNAQPGELPKAATDPVHHVEDLDKTPKGKSNNDSALESAVIAGGAVGAVAATSSLAAISQPKPSYQPVHSLQESTALETKPDSYANNVPVSTKAELPSFREIQAIKSTPERIATYNDIRHKWAGVDHGLNGWMSGSFAKYPEHEHLKSDTNMLLVNTSQDGIRVHRHNTSVGGMGQSADTPPKDKLTSAAAGAASAGKAVAEGLKGLGGKGKGLLGKINRGRLRGGDGDSDSSSLNFDISDEEFKPKTFTPPATTTYRHSIDHAGLSRTSTLGLDPGSNSPSPKRQQQRRSFSPFGARTRERPQSAVVTAPHHLSHVSIPAANDPDLLNTPIRPPQRRSFSPFGRREKVTAQAGGGGPATPEGRHSRMSISSLSDEELLKRPIQKPQTRSFSPFGRKKDRPQGEIVEERPSRAMGRAPTDEEFSTAPIQVPKTRSFSPFGRGRTRPQSEIVTTESGVREPKRASWVGGLAGKFGKKGVEQQQQRAVSGPVIQEHGVYMSGGVGGYQLPLDQGPPSGPYHGPHGIHDRPGPENVARGRSSLPAPILALALNFSRASDPIPALTRTPTLAPDLNALSIPSASLDIDESAISRDSSLERALKTSVPQVTQRDVSPERNEKSIPHVTQQVPTPEARDSNEELFGEEEQPTPRPDALTTAPRRQTRIVSLIMPEDVQIEIDDDGSVSPIEDVTTTEAREKALEALEGPTSSIKRASSQPDAEAKAKQNAAQGQTQPLDAPIKPFGGAAQQEPITRGEDRANNNQHLQPRVTDSTPSSSSTAVDPSSGRGSNVVIDMLRNPDPAVAFSQPRDMDGNAPPGSGQLMNGSANHTVAQPNGNISGNRTSLGFESERQVSEREKLEQQFHEARRVVQPGPQYQNHANAQEQSSMADITPKIQQGNADFSRAPNSPGPGPFGQQYQPTTPSHSVHNSVVSRDDVSLLATPQAAYNGNGAVTQVPPPNQIPEPTPSTAPTEISAVETDISAVGSLRAAPSQAQQQAYYLPPGGVQPQQGVSPERVKIYAPPNPDHERPMSFVPAPRDQSGNPQETINVYRPGGPNQQDGQMQSPISGQVRRASRPISGMYNGQVMGSPQNTQPGQRQSYGYPGQSQMQPRPVSGMTGQPPPQQPAPTGQRSVSGIQQGPAGQQPISAYQGQPQPVQRPMSGLQGQQTQRRPAPGAQAPPQGPPPGQRPFSGYQPGPQQQQMRPQQMGGQPPQQQAMNQRPQGPPQQFPGTPPAEQAPSGPPTKTGRFAALLGRKKEPAPAATPAPSPQRAPTSAQYPPQQMRPPQNVGPDQRNSQPQQDPRRQSMSPATIPEGQEDIQRRRLSILRPPPIQGSPAPSEAAQSIVTQDSTAGQAGESPTRQQYLQDPDNAVGTIPPPQVAPQQGQPPQQAPQQQQTRPQSQSQFQQPPEQAQAQQQQQQPTGRPQPQGQPPNQPQQQYQAYSQPQNSFQERQPSKLQRVSTPPSQEGAKKKRFSAIGSFFSRSGAAKPGKREPQNLTPVQQNQQAQQPGFPPNGGQYPPGQRPGEQHQQQRPYALAIPAANDQESDREIMGREIWMAAERRWNPGGTLMSGQGTFMSGQGTMMPLPSHPRMMPHPGQQQQLQQQQMQQPGQPAQMMHPQGQILMHPGNQHAIVYLSPYQVPGQAPQGIIYAPMPPQMQVMQQQQQPQHQYAVPPQPRNSQQMGGSMAQRQPSLQQGQPLPQQLQQQQQNGGMQPQAPPGGPERGDLRQVQQQRPAQVQQASSGSVQTISQQSPQAQGPNVQPIPSQLLPMQQSTIPGPRFYAQPQGQPQHPHPQMPPPADQVRAIVPQVSPPSVQPSSLPSLQASQQVSPAAPSSIASPPVMSEGPRRLETQSPEIAQKATQSIPQVKVLQEQEQSISPPEPAPVVQPLEAKATPPASTTPLSAPPDSKIEEQAKTPEPPRIQEPSSKEFGPDAPLSPSSPVMAPSSAIKTSSPAPDEAEIPPLPQERIPLHQPKPKHPTAQLANRSGPNTPQSKNPPPPAAIQQISPAPPVQPIVDKRPPVQRSASYQTPIQPSIPEESTPPQTDADVPSYHPPPLSRTTSRENTNQPDPPQLQRKPSAPTPSQLISDSPSRPIYPISETSSSSEPLDSPPAATTATTIPTLPFSHPEAQKSTQPPPPPPKIPLPGLVTSNLPGQPKPSLFSPSHIPLPDSAMPSYSPSPSPAQIPLPRSAIGTGAPARAESLLRQAMEQKRMGLENNNRPPSTSSSVAGVGPPPAGRQYGNKRMSSSSVRSVRVGGMEPIELPAGRMDEEDEPVMRATSYPGDEWIPSWDGD